jgi:phosphoribosylformimino-5-aminoimidazole carboxamide ribotide isomerase
MKIFPAIDIKNGACVRLLRGDFGTAEKVAEDALETAQGFARAGAKYLHMVDLDGAKDEARPNRKLIFSVASSCGLFTETGGGIRTMEDIGDCLGAGISRVILGSAALESPQLVKEAVRRYGARIAVGIDAKDGYVATHGWLDTSKIYFTDFAKSMEQIGVKTIIFTDISRDGTLGGPALGRLSELAAAVSCDIVASGGIKDLADIKALASMGLYGAICGKSLYSGTLDLAEAVKAAGPQ